MAKISPTEVVRYVEQNIGDFHKRRAESLESLQLTKVLCRKNPYLFKAKALVTPEQIVRAITDAHLSSQEEALLGDWLEGLAVFINGKVFNGWKSGIPGIDLEFDHEQIRYIVTIKSGPNWGNSKQLEKMKDDFITAKKTLRTSNSRLHVIAVNGCCYGRDNKPDKGAYFKYCGQRFWRFISDDQELYTSIIEPLGHKARERNDEFAQLYGRVITRFTREFDNEFCLADGGIDWQKIVKLNSSETPLARKASKKRSEQQQLVQSRDPEGLP